MGQRNPNPQFFQRWMILSHDFVGVSTCFNMFQPSQISGPGFRPMVRPMAPWFQVDHLADLPALLAIPLTLLSAGGGGNYLPDFQ
jgi:hypothetical protein